MTVAASNNAIGTGAIVLSTRSDELLLGLRKAEADTARSMAAIRSRLGSLSIGNPFKLMTAPQALLGIAGVGAGLRVVGSAIQTIHDTARQGDIAAAMGLTSEQFTGMAAVAKSVGEDTREFTESIVTMGKMISEADKGIGTQGQALFTALNRNVKEFVGLRADQQFYKMMAAIRAVQDPLARTRAIMLAFGEDGGKWLLPLLSKTPEELKRMNDAWQVSTEKMERAKLASITLRQAMMSFKMMWRDILIAAAPVFEFMGEEIDKLGRSFSDLELKAGEPLKNMIRLVAQLADAMRGLSGAMLQIEGHLLKNAEGIITVLALKNGASLPGWLGGPMVGIPAAQLAAQKAISEMRKRGISQGFEAAGEVMVRLGEKLNADPTAISRNAELFIRRLEARRKIAEQPGGFWSTVAGMIPPAAPAAMAQPPRFAAAVLQGTAEAYSLELKHQFGLDKKADDIPKKQLDVAKNTDKNIARIAAKIEAGDHTTIKVKPI